MNIIAQTTYELWCRGRIKTSPTGWISRNAVCCVHRGETADKRGRGGMIFTGGKLSYSCFNCGFKASFTAGRPLYPKFISLLEYLDIDNKTLNHLKLEALRLCNDTNAESSEHIPREIKPIVMPDSYLLQDNILQYPAHVSFIEGRGFSPSEFPFLVSNTPEFKSRVIIPFTLSDTIVGYSGRSIIPSNKNRYIMRTTTDYVFGLDFVEPEHEWVILTEGIFDALSVRGLAVMRNELTDTQAEMIHDIKKKIIVVPQLDKMGLSNAPNSLINTALDYGWDVAIPEWPLKDINAATVKYGPLFVVQHILKNTLGNQTTIKFRHRMLRSALK